MKVKLLKSKYFLSSQIVLFFNLWLFKIFSLNLLLGLTTLSSFLALYLAYLKDTKKYFTVSIIFIGILCLFQYQTASSTNITNLSAEDKYNQELRMRAYPPLYLTIANKKKYIPVAYWFEAKFPAVALYKTQQNIFAFLNPNLYFFANHPLERVGVVEFEKFPYIFLPVFFLGVFEIKKKQFKFVLLGAIPLLMFFFFAPNSSLGPFSLFPIISLLTSLGVAKVIENKKLVAPFLILLVLVFIQTLAYEIY